MAILESVKLSLRLSTAAFDPELEDLIAAAKTDLETSGIVNINDADPLTKHAIIVYAKANFGFGNSEAERYQAVYDSMKNKMAVTAEYITEVTP